MNLTNLFECLMILSNVIKRAPQNTESMAFLLVLLVGALPSLAGGLLLPALALLRVGDVLRLRELLQPHLWGCGKFKARLSIVYMTSRQVRMNMSQTLINTWAGAWMSAWVRG